MTKKALIIDDDIPTLELMKFQLEAEGFEVSRRRARREGLNYVEENEFDIILTDLKFAGLMTESKWFADARKSHPTRKS